MSSTNRGTVRNPSDRYLTPAWAVRAILPHVLTPTHSGAVLDPCCGDGGLLTVVHEHAPKAHLHGIELDEAYAFEAVRRLADARQDIAHADALTWDGPQWDCDLVLTNPPYSLAMDFVRRALDMMADRERINTIAMLLRLAFLEGAKRAGFHHDNPSDVYVLSKRPSFTGDGKSDSCAYAWFVWGDGRGGSWQVLGGDGRQGRCAA